MPDEGVLRLRRLEMVDTAGRVRMVLRTDDATGNAAVALLDEQGRTRATLSVDERGAGSLALAQSRGRRGFFARAAEDGAASVEVLAGGGRGVTVGVDTAGRAYLRMGNLTGREHGIAAVAPPEDAPPMVVMSHLGMERVLLTTEEDGTPSVHLVVERPEGGGPDGAKAGPDEPRADGQG
jgi:hypothetical protein